jgi:hypothetical protein
MKSATSSAVASIIGVIIPLLILIMMAFSHRFLTRHSNAMSAVSVGHVIASDSSLNESNHASSDSMKALEGELHNLAQEAQITAYHSSIDTTRKPIKLNSPKSIAASTVGSGFASVEPAGLAGAPQKGGKGPETLFVPRANFPEHLIRSGIVTGSALLHIRIDENGHCTVLNVLKITHEDLKATIIETVEKSLFQLPLRNGKVEPSEFVWPVDIRADETRVSIIRESLLEK